MAFQWLSRIRSSSTRPSPSAFLHILAVCDERLPISADELESAAGSEEDQNAKSIVQALIEGDSLETGLSAKVIIAVLRESVMELIAPHISAKAVDELGKAANNPRRVRAFIDRLDDGIRDSVRAWISLFVKRAIQPRHRRTLQLCAFVLLSRISYNRLRFVRIADESLGALLIANRGFLFLEAAPPPSPINDNAALLEEISLLKSQLDQKPKGEIVPRPSEEKWDSFGGFVWRRVSREGPCPRYRHSASFDRRRGLFLIHGGLCGDRQLDDVWALDVRRLTWRAMECRGGVRARYGHAAVVLGHALVVFGGISDRVATDHVAVLDSAIWRWRYPGSRRPEAREGHIMVQWKEDELLLFGGQNGARRFNDLWKYSVRDEVWTALAVCGAIPGPVRRPLLDWIGPNRLLLAGSDEAYLGVVVGDEIQWEEMTTDAIPLIGLGVAFGKDAVAIGEISPMFGEDFSKGMASFKTALFRWRKSWKECRTDGPRPQVRFGATLTKVADKKAILFGGYVDGDVLSDLWILEAINSEH